MNDNEVKVPEGGAESIPPKGPAEVPPKKDAPEGGEEHKADPAQEPKTPTQDEIIEVLNEADLNLQKAENEIIRLKKLATDGGGNSDGNAELLAKIEALEKEVTSLKGDKKDTPDPTLQEVQASHAKINHLKDALISKKTAGAGTGRGGSQDQPPAPKKEPHLSDREREIIARMEKRRIEQGRDPKTGLPIKK